MPMKRSTVSALLLATATLAGAGLTGEAQAQTLELPRSRQGYYMGGGYHAGATRFKEEGDKLGAWFTRTLKLHAGQMVTEHLGLGLNLELGGAWEEMQGSALYGGEIKGQLASLIGLGAEGQWELLPNLALHGGVGFGVIVVTDNDEPDEPLRGSYGGTYTLGLSYDWFPRKPKLSGGWSLTPVATVEFLPNDPVSATVFTLGLEILYWNGLPKNELNLPAGEGYEK